MYSSVQVLTDEYKVIFVSFKTDDYNSNIFVSTDNYKTTNEGMSFSCSVYENF
jgi:hypothetical protein